MSWNPNGDRPSKKEKPWETGKDAAGGEEDSSTEASVEDVAQADRAILRWGRRRACCVRRLGWDARVE